MGKKHDKSKNSEKLSDESLLKETKKILKANEIHLTRRLGQNYLIDDSKRKKIVSFGNLSKKDTVLEVGSGIGTLTLELAKKAKRVIAIEQDKKIFNILKKRLEENSIENVDLINEDALKVDFPKFNKIIANLPYQISSPITFKFLEYSFELAILMYQKEFAKRMQAKVGEKNYSRLSAMLYFKGSVEFLDEVAPNSFIPQPKVHSTVIKLTPFKSNNYSYKQSYDETITIPNTVDIDKEYSTICRALFQHKRKKVKNALIDSRHVLGYNDKKEIKDSLESSTWKNPDLNTLMSKKVIATSPEEILDLSNHLKCIIKS